MQMLTRCSITDFVVCGPPVEPPPGCHVTNVGSPYLKQAEPYVDGDLFVMADGRGHGPHISDIEIDAMVTYANSHGRLATVNAVKLRDEYISGGIFILRRGVFDYLKPDEELEHEPLIALATDGELCAFRHEGAATAA